VARVRRRLLRNWHGVFHPYRPVSREMGGTTFYRMVSISYLRHKIVPGCSSGCFQQKWRCGTENLDET
jgi:hypothetical protein